MATFETWTPPDREFDVIIAGQAWHWVDPVAGAAKAARVLRPGGRLAVFWNVPRLPSDLTEAVAAACERVMPEKPFDFQTMAKPALDAYAPILAKAAGGIREAGGFDDPEQWRFTWEATYTRDEWLDQLPTFGIVTNLPPDKQAELLAEIRPAIDAMDDTFTLPYTTVAVAATRLRAPAA